MATSAALSSIFDSLEATFLDSGGMTEVGEGVEEGVRVVGVAGGGGDVLREPENPNRLG